MNTSTTQPGARAVRRPYRLLVSTLKGGPGKTTTAWMVALGYARAGYTVAVICADVASQGLRDWYRCAIAAGYTVPFTVHEWNGADADGPISEFAELVETQGDADMIVIDTGGERADVFMSAALYCERLLSPVGPFTAEVRRAAPTARAAGEIDRMSRSGLLMSVLLTKVPAPGQGRARTAREFLAGKPTEDDPQRLDLHVMGVEIPMNLALYEGIYGTVPTDLGAYGDLVAEMLAETDVDAVDAVAVQA